MKKKILFLLLTIFAFVPRIWAISYAESGETVNQEGMYDSVRFIAGNKVTSNATVDGLSFVAGNNVSVTGNVNYGFYAGNIVTINENVEKDLFAAGNAVEIGSDAIIGRDAFIAANTAVISSDITRNLFVGASSVNLSGITVNGDAHIDAAEIIMDESTVINGTLTYQSSAKLVGIDEATINVKKMVESKERTIEFNPINYVYAFIITVVAGFIVMSVLFYLIPSSKEKLLKTKLEFWHIAKMMGIGVLVLLTTPFIAFLGMLTGFLTPLAIITFAIYFIACYLSTLIVAFVVGNVISTKLFKNDSVYLAIIIGIVLFRLIALIPTAGLFIVFLATLYGLGLIFTYIISRGK